MGNRRLILDEVEIIRLYTHENKSALQISKIMGCSVMAIFRRLAKYNIKTKSQSEIMLGRKISEDHRQKIIANLKPQTGKDNPNWKGGRSWRGRDKEHKYVIVRIKGKYIPEHRYLMEQYLGRRLSREEHVHHINHNRTDNRLENLQLISNSDHLKLHWDDKRRANMSEKIRLARAKKWWSTKSK